MLLQSDDDVVSLLPALPSAWPQGKVRGLRARGGVRVDMEWANGQLIDAALTSDTERKLTLRNGGRSTELTLRRGRPLRLGADLSPKI